MDRLRTALFALASLAAAAGTARAQTAIWSGGFPNDNFDTATNWVGGLLPLNDGTETLEFTAKSDSVLNLNVAADFLGIAEQIDDSGDTIYADIQGSHSLTLGAGGISVVSNTSTGNQLTFDVPVVLSANQTWSAVENGYGSITANGAISGAYGLTLSGDPYGETFVLNSGSSTFTGGVTVPGGSPAISTTLVIGASSAGPAGAPTSGPVGTGTLTLGDSTILTTSGSPVTLGNALVIGDNSNGSPVTFGGTSGPYSPASTSLTLTGPVTLYDSDQQVNIGPNSTITFSGAITGNGSGLYVDGVGPNSLGIVQGSFSNVTSLTLLGNASVILDGSGPSQVAGMTGGISTSSNVDSNAYTYLGLGGTSAGGGYAASGNVANFLTFLNTVNSATGFVGTLGFDTVSGSAATFGDAVDLTNFTAGGFIGLGSATQAILTGAITPPGGSSGTNYPFGGGGGMLTVDSALTDGPETSRSLTLSAGNGPLTLVLSGALSYSGGTYVDGGALIFNTPPPSANPGSLSLAAGPTYTGYVGATTASGYSDANSNIQAFINLVSSGGSEGVIGFDSLTGTQTVTSNIVMPEGTYYLGTATSVIYSGTITPAGSEYQFSGVKGGQVTVSSTLTDGSGTPNSVVVGLPTPLEGLNPATGLETVSSVTLSGGNSYTGGTTLNSGILFVTNSSSLGAAGSPLYVPGNGLANQWAGTLAASGAAVTLSNPIFTQGNGLALNTGSANTLTLLGTIADLEDAGSIGIFGPVSIQGNNTYSGGTTINVSGSTPITVGSNTGLGTGPVSASGGTIAFTGTAPILNPSDVSQGTSFEGSQVTFSGSPVIYSLEMAESTLNFNGALATINGFSGDSPGSGNTINLGSETVLAIDTDYGTGNNGGTYHGVIAGATGSLVVMSDGSGSLDLTGANTYGGGTTVEGGSVLIASNDSALGTGPVTVNGGGLVTNTGVTITNPITLVGGSSENISGLAGFGTFSPGGTITFQNYGIVDPGRTAIGNGGNANLSIPVPGTLSFGGATSLNFGPGGWYVFALTDANGATGTGYSTVNLESPGALTISATMSNPFYINLYSYDPSTNQSGNALNFNPANSYSWTLLTSSSPITGFNPSSFAFITTHFTNSLGIGSFFVSVSGDDLMLNFTPVPEPSTLALMASGLAVVAAAVRRRRR